jgi:hypothetical protein
MGWVLVLVLVLVLGDGGWGVRLELWNGRGRFGWMEMLEVILVNELSNKKVEKNKKKTSSEWVFFVSFWEFLFDVRLVITSACMVFVLASSLFLRSNVVWTRQKPR